MKKAALYAAMAAVLGVSTTAFVDTQAATLNTGDTLTISTGIMHYDANGNPTNISPGSWFGADTNSDGVVSGNEKAALAQGTTGLVIGVTTSAGASHYGCPAAGDTNAITAPWCYYGNTGSDYATTAVTGSTTTGLNLSGWMVAWNGILLNVGSGAWGVGYSDGVANFVWDGVYGHSYTLDYRAAVPPNDPSGFGNLKYALHLAGTVTAVPIPAAVWLLGSGLMGLAGSARRRRNPA